MSYKRLTLHALKKHTVEHKIRKIQLAARGDKVKRMILQRLMSGKRRVFQLLRCHTELAREAKRRYQLRVNESLRFLSSRIIFQKRHVLQKWNRFTAERKRMKEVRDRAYAAAMRKFQEILSSTKQHSFTKWARLTKQVRSSYVVAMAKFKHSMMYSKRDSFSRWVQYAHDVRLRRVVENSQMRAVLEIVKQQNGGVLRRAMAKWHRLVLANKLESKRISHREARMLDMMSNLLAKGIRRILHRWHSTCHRLRAERGEDSHKRAKIQHAIYKSTQLLRSKEMRAVSRSMKKWWSFMLHDRNGRDRLHLACRRVFGVLVTLAKAKMNQAFLRLCRNAHLTAHHQDKMSHGFRVCVSVLRRRELRLCGSALRIWQSCLHSIDSEQERVNHGKVSFGSFFFFFPLHHHHFTHPHTPGRTN